MTDTERTALLQKTKRVSFREESKKADSSPRFPPPARPRLDDERPQLYTSLSNVLKEYVSSDSQRTLALRKPGVGPAAFLIRDAVLTEVENPAAGAYDPYHDEHNVFRNAVSVWCRRLCARRSLVYTWRAAAWVLCLLTFFEPPPWCREEDGGGCHELLAAKGPPAAGEDESAEDIVVDYYPNTGTSLLLTQQESHVIEAICLVVLYIYTLLRIGRDGMSLRIFLRRGRGQPQRIGQLICLLILAAGLLLEHWTHFDFSWSHAYFRLILVITFSTGARRDMMVVLHMLPVRASRPVVYFPETNCVAHA
jgi:hypothetical protein